MIQSIMEKRGQEEYKLLILMFCTQFLFFSFLFFSFYFIVSIRASAYSLKEQLQEISTLKHFKSSHSTHGRIHLQRQKVQQSIGGTRHQHQILQTDSTRPQQTMGQNDVYKCEFSRLLLEYQIMLASSDVKTAFESRRHLAYRITETRN